MISDVINTYNYTAPNLIDSIDFKANFTRLAKETGKITFEYDLKAKTRFTDIYCPKHTALKLEDPSGEQTLHANNVHLGNVKVICTQAPLTYYDDNTTELFWKIVSQRSNLIVDLTNPKDMTEEGGVGAYYPRDKGHIYITGIIKIRCKERKILKAEPLIEEFTYKIYNTKQKKTITRLHFNGWPDGQALSPKILVELIECIKTIKRKFDDTLPEIVHCRAGIGRTGCLVVSQAISDLIESEQVDETTLVSKIDKLILEGRQARGPSFVQNENQYKSIVLLGIHLLNIKTKASASS